MSSVVILSGVHLCHNPRVIKEATALQSAGCDVEVLGGWFDPVLKVRDQELMRNLNFRFRPLHDLTRQSTLRFGLRAGGKIARTVHATIGHENYLQLGYFGWALRQEARNTKADLLIAHSEQALWAIAQLSASSPHTKLGLDMEDWFSEDLPAKVRRQRPVKLLRKVEEKLLRNAAHATCTSRAMSEALANEYGCHPPVPIYNAFPWSDRMKLDGQFKDRMNCNVPTIHWYSQTLGTDRGLGDLFAALPRLKYKVEVHLRGRPVANFEKWLAKCVPENWRSRIFIHDLVSNEELLSRITEHDVGFAGEIRHCRNNELTVSNKILHYLVGGLAVVASDTAGQKEIAEQATDAVTIYPSGAPEALANELNSLLSSPQSLRASKAAAIAAAEKVFCWERQIPVLLESVRRAIGQRTGTGRL